MKRRRRHHRPLLAAVALAAAACTTPTPRDVRVYIPEGAHVDKPHKLPSQCASGCSVKPDAARRVLSDEELDTLLTAYGQANPAEESEALNELLFYAGQARVRLDEPGRPQLSDAHLRFLGRELGRTTARIEMRVVDEHGVVRAWLPEKRVPLGEKQHLHLEDKALPGLIASGTVLRTSLYHLWTRI